jgi:hypothetical protein
VEEGLAASLVVGTIEEGAVVAVVEGNVVVESAEVVLAGGIAEAAAGVEVAEQILVLEGIVAKVVAAGVVGVAEVGFQRVVESPEEAREEEDLEEAPEEVQTEVPVQEEDLVGTLSEEHSQGVVPFEEVVVTEEVLDRVQHQEEGLVEPVGEAGRLEEAAEIEVEEASDREKGVPLEELVAQEVGN